MSSNIDIRDTELFWNKKYQTGKTGWDIGEISTPIKEYIDQLTDKDFKILIPGGGNSYEAEYLHVSGFTDVSVVDVSLHPLRNLKKRVPSFPEEKLLHLNFFDLKGQYDLILEQTFFCALPPVLRLNYVTQMKDLLKTGGNLVGVMFNMPLNEDHPPFGGNEVEYQHLFENEFQINKMETAYNSITPRAGKELFVRFIKK